MSLFAQTFGEVTGHISDATGAATPGAKIVLTNVATNAIRETVSTDSGDYTFAAAPPGQFGNVGRNAIQDPGIIGLDGEIHKVFRIRERHTFQFRLEAFNARNHPNWGMPNRNILSGAARPGLPSTAAHANFGVVTSTSGAMRQLQLGLKYSF
jgi:hypothetical protein